MKILLCNNSVKRKCYIDNLNMQCYIWAAMGEHQPLSILGEIETQRLQKAEQSRRIAAGQVFVKPSRRIIESLFKGRELLYSNTYPDGGYNALYIQIPTLTDPIEVIISRIGKEEIIYNSLVHTDNPPFRYDLNIKENPYVVHYTEKSVFIGQKRKLDGYDLDREEAQRYLDFLKHIKLGLETGTVGMKNELTPQAKAKAPRATVSV